MKSTSYLIFLLFAFSCLKPVTQNNATITFTQTQHDFGTLQQNQKAECNFSFSNPGKEPLLIQNVISSCGCTVPGWPKQPIKPGGKGKISIKYDTAYPEAFSKSITVYYNGKNSPVHLKIKGSVNYPKNRE